MINAVICEFNPFHNGHKYLLEKAAEKTGADATVCIMSGNFVQRGEPSLWDKHTRAKAAVKGGADLVLQLPTAHVLAGASVFATAGVYIANSLGIETSLCFGSESEDITALFNLAQADRKKLDENFKVALSKGVSYAQAAQMAYSMCGLDAQILRTPNNLLAFEYIKAAVNLGSNMTLVNIQRTGDSHDGQNPDGKFASASYIRKNIAEDMSAYAEGLEKPSIDIEKFYQYVLFSLYTKTKSQLSTYADMTEGIENKFYEVCRKANSFEQLCQSVKSKRYTSARIRRTAINAFLENPKGLYKQMPDCLRVLAFNDKGRELLKELSTKSKLPIVIKPADYEKSGSAHFEFECRVSDLYDYCCFDRKGGGVEYRQSPIYVK